MPTQSILLIFCKLVKWKRMQHLYILMNTHRRWGSSWHLLRWICFWLSQGSYTLGLEKVGLQKRDEKKENRETQKGCGACVHKCRLTGLCIYTWHFPFYTGCVNLAVKQKQSKKWVHKTNSPVAISSPCLFFFITSCVVAAPFSPVRDRQ